MIILSSKFLLCSCERQCGAINKSAIRRQLKDCCNSLKIQASLQLLQAVQLRTVTAALVNKLAWFGKRGQGMDIDRNRYICVTKLYYSNEHKNKGKVSQNTTSFIGW